MSDTDKLIQLNYRIKCSERTKPHTRNVTTNLEGEEAEGIEEAIAYVLSNYISPERFHVVTRLLPRRGPSRTE